MSRRSREVSASRDFSTSVEMDKGGRLPAEGMARLPKAGNDPALDYSPLNPLSFEYNALQIEDRFSF